MVALFSQGPAKTWVGKAKGTEVNEIGQLEDLDFLRTLFAGVGIDKFSMCTTNGSPFSSKSRVILCLIAAKVTIWCFRRR